MINTEIFDFTPPFVVEKLENGLESLNLPFITIDTASAVQPWNIQPFPVTFYAPLGAIIVQWGSFEIIIEELIKILEFSALNIEKSRHGFRARCKHLQKLSAEIFTGRDDIRNYIDSVLTESENLYEKRNIIAHGRLWTQIKAEKPADTEATTDHFLASVFGEGNSRGCQIDVNFTMHDLKSIFYSIANLSGRIREITVIDCKIPNLDKDNVNYLRKIINNYRSSQMSNR